MKNIRIKKKQTAYSVGKIVCVGRNYSEHIKELGSVQEEKPVIFLKPASALIFSGEKIIHPTFSNNLHHEVELVLLIDKQIKDVTLLEAENAIAGYSVGLDMTLRDVQNELKAKGNPWTISKCFDTSAVVSDFILKTDYSLTQNEFISLRVNGVEKQNDSLSKMIFSPAELVQYISSLMTLEEGDLIYTGTPAGVGRVERGDKIEAKIENIGLLQTEII
jgi:5-carboxymethyl-2-hydroxymuconate isomerase